MLDQIEAHLGNQSDPRMPLNKPLPEIVVNQCDELRNAAQTFLEQNFDPSLNSEATAFCRQCNDSAESRIIENLMSREGRVLQQKGNDVVPGSAFRGSPLLEPETARSDEEDGEETQIPNSIQWPPGISHRVRNLFLFNLDLRGELDQWLAPTVSASEKS